MCGCIHTRLLIAGIAITSSLISSLFLSYPWHMAIIEGRSFQCWFGLPFTVLPLLSNVPFLWPYPIAGLVLALRLPSQQALRWALGTGLAGTVLHLLLFRVEYGPPPMLGDHIESFITHMFPILFAVLGWVVGKGWPRQHRREIQT